MKQKRIWFITEKETLGPSHTIFMRQDYLMVSLVFSGPAGGEDGPNWLNRPRLGAQELRFTPAQPFPLPSRGSAPGIPAGASGAP